MRTVISVSLSREAIDMVDSIADRLNISKSEVIARAIMEYAKRRGFA